MATTTAKNKRPASPKTPEPAQAPSDKPQPNGNGDDLKAAYWTAIDKRSNDKGDIPAAQLTAVTVAYAQTAPQKRANLVKRLSLEAADRVLNDAGEVDHTIVKARKILDDAIEDARKETSRNERPPHDPVPDLARYLAALDTWRQDAIAELTDDQRKALADFKVDSNDDETLQAAATLSKALASIRSRALKGRNGHSGPRLPADQVEAALRKALNDAGRPLTCGDLARVTGIKASTWYTRWNVETPGIKTTKGDKGERLFDQDRDAA